MPQESIGDQAHHGIHSLNPFSRRDEYSRESILFYKITTFISYLILLVTAIYYDIHAPTEGKYGRHTIWGQNGLHRDSPFTQSAIMTSIYWLILFILQLVYTIHLYSSNASSVTAAANIGSHYVASNLLLFGFIHLWTRSHFVLALLLIIINFFNLSFAYFRHSAAPRLIHIATVSGPLAWNFVALYWVSAVAVNSHSLPARIVANIFVWGILAYGAFFLAAFKDYTIGFALSYLAFSTGVGQFHHGIVNIQWIFAFAIGGLLFLLSLAVGLRERGQAGGEIVSEDRERAPLLADD